MSNQFQSDLVAIQSSKHARWITLAGVFFGVATNLPETPLNTPILLYLHGFLSSPQSHKALHTQAWLSNHRPQWQFMCPELSPHPAQALETLEACMKNYRNHPVYLLGSSLGGFWATFLAERYDLPAVLINPAVHPYTRFQEFAGRPLKHYHYETTYVLEHTDLEKLKSCSVSKISYPERYWLLVQTGDETLDYRQAVELYQGCRQMVEPGGSHAFEGFESWLPEFAAFFEAC